MISRSVGNYLLLDYEFLVDFCKSIENTDKKVKTVYLSSDGKRFSVYTNSMFSSVIGGVCIEGLSVFGFGVEAERLVALSKKLHGKGEIRMTIFKNYILIQEDNVSVKFPTSILVQHPGVPDFGVIDSEASSWIASQVSEFSKIIPNSLRHPGILIDNNYRNVTRLIQFGENAFRVASFPKVELAHSRIIIPPEISKSIRSLKERVSALLYRDGHFGVSLKSGLYFYMPTLVDSHPLAYSSYLHLRDHVDHFEEAGGTFIFDKNRLIVILETISSVMSEEETMVRFDFVGISESKLPVWKISSASVTGFYISESIECLDGSDSSVDSFRVNRKVFLNSVKECDGNPVLMDMGNMFALSDGKVSGGATVVMKDMI